MIMSMSATVEPSDGRWAACFRRGLRFHLPAVALSHSHRGLAPCKGATRASLRMPVLEAL